MGKHRKATNRSRENRRPSQATVSRSRKWAAIGAAAVIPALGFAGSGEALAADNLDIIAQCESGNRNVRESTGSTTASGYWQIVNGTWAANGGREFAPTAIQASRAEQRIVAENIVKRRGSYADWNASKKCWGSKIGSPTAVQAAATVVVPAAEPANGSYVVRKGDTLSEIAAANGTTWQSLAEKNSLSNPNLIFPGQILDL